MASKDVKYLFKQYYGRNPNKKEMRYWKDKDPFRLRDALRDSTAPAKRQRVAKIFKSYLGKGYKPTKKELSYWANKTTKELKGKLSKDARVEIRKADQAIEDQRRKQEAQDKERRQYIEEEFEPAWKKRFNQEQAEYKDTLSNANDRIQKLKRDYKVAIQRGDKNLARNIKRLHDDYSERVGQMIEDRNYEVGELEQRTGQQLQSADVSYAERGLFRSGARKAKKEYIQEEADEDKSKYLREFERRKQQAEKQKQRQTGDWRRGWKQQKSDLGSDYKSNLGTAKRSKKGLKRSWKDWLDKFKTGKQTYKATYMQKGKAEDLLGGGYQGFNESKYKFK